MDKFQDLEVVEKAKDAYERARVSFPPPPTAHRFDAALLMVCYSSPPVYTKENIKLRTAAGVGDVV